MAPNRSSPEGRILLLLRVPPPFGGGEVRAQWLADATSGLPDFAQHVWRTPVGSRATQGRLSFLTVWQSMRRLIGVWSAILRDRPRVVFLSLPKTLFPFFWAAMVIVPASWLGIRVCGELAGMRFEFCGWQRRLGQWVLRRLYSIRFLAHSIRDAHAAWNLKHAVVVYNGVDAPPPVERTKGFVHARPLRVIYIGLLDESKGVDVVVEAAGLARRAGMDVEWILVGEWSSRKFECTVRQRLRALGVEERVRFPGLVIGEAKWELIRSAHVLVHPTRLDGQPLAILEAMSQGLAVISTPVGAIPETVVDGRNGCVLRGWGAEELMAALRAFDEDREWLHRVMNQNIEDFQARFTAARYVERIVEWLRACAANRVDKFLSDVPGSRPLLI